MDYQELFNYMANNHNVNLLESEMQEVIIIVKRMLNNDEAPNETPSVNNNEAQRKNCNKCGSDNISFKWDAGLWMCDNCDNVQFD